jgi:hypothetical protein
MQNKLGLNMLWTLDAKPHRTKFASSTLQLKKVHVQAGTAKLL